MFQSRFGGNVTPIYLRGAQGVGISNVHFDRDTGKIETTLTNGTVKTQDFDFGGSEAVNFGTVEEPVEEVYIQENRTVLNGTPEGAIKESESSDFELYNSQLLDFFEPYFEPDKFRFGIAKENIDATFEMIRTSYNESLEEGEGDGKGSDEINPDVISFIKQTKINEGVYKYALDNNQLLIMLLASVKRLNKVLTGPPSVLPHSLLPWQSRLYQVELNADLWTTFVEGDDIFGEYCLGQSNIAHPIYTENNTVPRKLYQYAFRLPTAVTFINNEVAFTCDLFSTNENGRMGGDSFTVRLLKADFDTPYDFTELLSVNFNYYDEGGYKVYSAYAIEDIVVPVGSFLVFTVTPETPYFGVNPFSFVGHLTVMLNYVRGNIHEGEDDEEDDDDHGYDV